MRKKGWQVRCFVHQVFEGLVDRSAEFGVVQHHPTTWCVEPVRHRETAHTAHLQVLADNIIRRPDSIMFTVWSMSLDKSAADSCRRVVFMPCGDYRSSVRKYGAKQFANRSNFRSRSICHLSYRDTNQSANNKTILSQNRNHNRNALHPRSFVSWASQLAVSVLPLSYL